MIIDFIAWMFLIPFLVAFLIIICWFVGILYISTRDMLRDFKGE